MIVKRFFDTMHQEYKNAGIDEYTKQGQPVKFWHGFQSLNDLRNDLQAIFIKPLVNIYLFAVYKLQFTYELYLAAIHALTLSSKCVTHLGNALRTALYSLVSLCAAVGEFVTQALSFLIRLGMTGNDALKKLTFEPTVNNDSSAMRSVPA